jgi:hypothetical protein
METTKAQARAYVKQGWYVMPLLPKSKEPHFDLIKNGHLSATTDIDLLNHWFELDPQMNIGISCAMSELVVLDIDYRNGGQRTADMTDTYTVKTGNGLHLYYRAPMDARFKGALNKGVDVKHRGYVVAANSIHPNGKKYELVNEMAPVALPAPLIALLDKTRAAA